MSSGGSYAIVGSLIVSDNGHPLVLVTLPASGRGVVTVANYIKWYTLHIVRRLDEHIWIEKLIYPDMGSYSEIGPPFVNHVPNPIHVIRYCRAQNLELDSCALEMMIGRWLLEGIGSGVKQTIDSKWFKLLLEEANNEP